VGALRQKADPSPCGARHGVDGAGSRESGAHISALTRPVIASPPVPPYSRCSRAFDACTFRQACFLARPGRWAMTTRSKRIKTQAKHLGTRHDTWCQNGPSSMRLKGAVKTHISSARRKPLFGTKEIAPRIRETLNTCLQIVGGFCHAKPPTQQLAGEYFSNDSALNFSRSQTGGVLYF
jgi:hypothetical protein